jgi:hypothetical protein
VSEDLIDWLRRQIDEDEQSALAVVEQDWRPDGANSCQVYAARDDGSNRTIAWCRNGYDDDFANALHIARHDPARVLRDVKAFRKIIDYCASAIEVGRIPEGATWSDDAAGAEVGEVVLRHLAAIFSDRPGYREEWRP